MPEVIGIRFKPVTKIYYFRPPDVELKFGEPVIVYTTHGEELGWVASEAKVVPDSKIKGMLKDVLRRADPLDLMSLQEYHCQEPAALEECKTRAEELGLAMKVLKAEYAYDGSRILFSFSAEQRIDFRELVRVLVRSLRTRVEMRQVGARDESKAVSGYGKCGRPLCCSSWLTEFHSVSIRMAKNQKLPLAHEEISGQCGRFLCCLAYEDKFYTEMKMIMPSVGTIVHTPEGMSKIKGLNIIKQTVIVETEQDTIVELP
ncbi:MAG: hypothetical protein B6242_11310, partial [Anaerolineaceae bacterium 4572_78]